jgi:crotonobetainyl-CoA:carnitine CoA-transferase CaiB-like acyl-CoA transferase
MMAGIGAAKCNTGKESICLDLKHPEGQRIAQALINRADVFIHNYRPGVPERLGLDYEQLAQTNPRIVYVSANGYGPNGPGAHRPSTHPIPGAALGGVNWQLGGLPEPGPMSLDEIRETTRRLFRANEVNPDPNTSMVIATAVTLGLLARETTGKGQKILVDMFGANAYANWDDFLQFPGKPERAAVDPGQHGLGPGYRLYPCRRGWVFLAAPTDKQWASLEVADEAELESLLATKDAQDWEEELSSRGIGCVRADAGWPGDFLLRDPIAAAEALTVPAEHPEWGSYLRHGPMVRFDTSRKYPGPSMPGDSTPNLLAEIGIDADTIQTLLETSVVEAYRSDS